MAGSVSAVMLAVAACGGGGGDDGNATGGNPPPPPPPPPTGNQAPTISGAPALQIVQGATYGFLPAASDGDGDPLTFSIANMPAWASFNPSTGQLSGVPANNHLGLHSGVSLSVSDGQDTASLASFDVEVLATATGALTLSWTPPMENTDGSQLDDLAGYRIRWGTQSGLLPNTMDVDSPGISSFTVDELPDGNYFFTVSALDLANNESAPSSEAGGMLP